MSSPSQPPAPDFEAAAETTAAGNLENLFTQTELNRYDQLTPLGSMTWTQGPTIWFVSTVYVSTMG